MCVCVCVCDHPTSRPSPASVGQRSYPPQSVYVLSDGETASGVEVEREEGGWGRRVPRERERDRGGGEKRYRKERLRTSNGRVKCFILKQCREGQTLRGSNNVKQ